MFPCTIRPFISVSIIRSNNANSGIEFTWSIWLLLKNNTSDKKYKNIFNKGDSYYNHTGISLVNNSPGLYLSSLVNNQNILHVIMDTVNPSDGPSIIDIDGLPFNKWFHVAIRIQNKVLDVYCLTTNPLNYQPSGAINLSKFKNIELEISTFTPTILPNNSSFTVICSSTGNPIAVTRKPGWQLFQYSYNMTIYEERYNILSFIDGNVGMMFTR